MPTTFHDYITDFIFVEDTPEKADIIFVPGGSCGEIAVHAAALYKLGLAPLILVTGKYSVLDNRFPGVLSPSRYTSLTFADECSFFITVLKDHGVPEYAILKDANARYTYENAIHSRKLTDSHQLSINKAIISCQAYHAKRALIYYQLLYPETQFFVSPTVTKDISRDNWFLSPAKIDLVLGEVERCGSQFHNILKNSL